MSGFSGGVGDDVFHLSGKGMLQAGDVIDGGSGNDTLEIDYYDDNLDLTKITLTSVEAIDQMYYSGKVTMSSAQLNGLRSIIVDTLAIADSGQVTLVGSGGMNRIDLPTVGGHLDMSRFTTSFTGARAPYIYGGAGDDVVVGSSSADYMRGDNGDDSLSGGAGIDILDGGVGNDTLHGGADDDRLDGGAGIDKLYGDAGDDSLAVGDMDAAGEIYDGGAGTDTLDVDNAPGVDLSKATITNVEILEGQKGGATLSIKQLSLFETIDVPGITLADGGAVDFSKVHFADGLQPGLTLSAAGNSVALAGTGVHNVTGADGNDIIIGGALADMFEGNGGNDSLDGGGGADFLEGGSGNDTYYVDDPGDIVFEGDPNGGNDTVHSTIDYYLGSFVENLYLDGLAINGTGNDLANRLYGNAQANLLDGGAGADTMTGGDGNDTYYVDDAGDKIVEQAGQGIDTVYASVSTTLSANVEVLVLTNSWFGAEAIDGTGNPGNNTLIGNDAANTLTAGAGDDLIDGHGGADKMVGGDGNDTYYVDNAGDRVIEGATGGNDIVYSSVSYDLVGQYVETLVLTGTAGLTAKGNSQANMLVGNAGANVLNGMGGADTMIGGAGDDIYYVDDAGDVVTEAANAGFDTVISSIDYALGDNVEGLALSGTAKSGTGNDLANILVGNASANILSGGGGGDILDGAAGADTMIGGAGDDLCYVDNAGDVVTEAAGAGFDTVISSIDYTLGDNVEGLALSGTARSGTGNDLANILVGNSADNVLNGGGGGDILNGAAGADTMNGGAGDDLYYVDNAGDRIVEAADGGNDTVYATVSYQLTDLNVEQLVLTGTAGINATGNAQANMLVGNAGNNVLDGLAGRDTMSGGDGNDTYYVDNTYDKVIEGATGGNDLVYASASFNLAGQYVETLQLTGSAGINATGNTLANTLIGNAGNNVLNGLGGNDTLTGGAGADTFLFNSTLGVSNVDTITDFTVGSDLIALDHAVFAAAGAVGALSAAAFGAGTAATSASQRILYDSATGNLWYDADGNGAGKAVQFATVTAGLSLTAASFRVV